MNILKHKFLRAPSLKLLRPYLDPKFLLGLLFLVIVIINLTGAAKELSLLRQLKRQNRLYFAGIKFSGLDDILKGAQYVGYYTDKDQSDKKNSAQFSQAQYILAPAILDFNNLNHEFILFDCTTEKKAFSKIREMRAMPLRKNRFGIILAERKQ